VSEAPSKVVLVVDDDLSVRSLLVRALTAKGYQVQQAADGLAASELLGRMARAPDLLICDVMMPTIDGFSLARLIKGRPELRGMPIIFLTARTQPNDLVQGINLGARHYVQKPFNVKDLMAKVEMSMR
jgi:DNA-binding response OmpR family regulator